MDLYVETSALGSTAWISDTDGELVASTWFSDTEWNELLAADIAGWRSDLGFQLEMGSEWMRHDEWLRGVCLTNAAHEAHVAAVEAMLDRFMVDEEFAEWLETGGR